MKIAVTYDQGQVFQHFGQIKSTHAPKADNAHFYSSVHRYYKLKCDLQK